MKKTLLIVLASVMMAGCYNDDKIPNTPSGNYSGGGSGSTTTSHYCGYTTQKGTPCKRLVSGSTGYCWQHK